MQATEKQIRLAAKMYEVRDTLKRLTPKYDAIIAEWMAVIHEAQDHTGMDLMPLVLKMCEATEREIDQMWLTAAAVEICDGDKRAEGSKTDG